MVTRDLVGDLMADKRRWWDAGLARTPQPIRSKALYERLLSRKAPSSRRSSPGRPDLAKLT